MDSKRTVVGKFVHTTWINLNVRCGNGIYHKHCEENPETKEKSKHYENVEILFSRLEFKEWCWKNQAIIEGLIRPSIDRLDKRKSYSIDNINIIELKHNIRKDKTVFIGGTGVCFVCNKTKKETDFIKDQRRQNGRRSICLSCENERCREKYRRLGR